MPNVNSSDTENTSQNQNINNQPEKASLHLKKPRGQPYFNQPPSGYSFPPGQHLLPGQQFSNQQLPSAHHSIYQTPLSDQNQNHYNRSTNAPAPQYSQKMSEEATNSNQNFNEESHSTHHNEKPVENASTDTTQTDKPAETNIHTEATFQSEHTAKIVENTINAVNSKVTHLVEWENTVHSGAALATILGFLIFTAYNSLFNTFCFLAIAVIGIDWLYVLGNKQFKTLFNQNPDNPHEYYLRNPPRISRQSVYKYVDVFVDLINKALAEGTKIVFVEDPLRSVKYVIALYITWTIASWFSFRTIIALIVITGFTVPKLYKQNKHAVDQHFNQAQEFARNRFERGYAAVQKHTGCILDHIQSYAASKGYGKSNKKE